MREDCRRRGGLHDGLVRVGAGHHHQLDVLAGLFGQRDDVGEDRRLVVGRRSVPRSRPCSPEPAWVTWRTESTTMSILRVSVLREDALQVLQAVGIAHGHQEVAGTHVDGLCR